MLASPAIEPVRNAHTLLPLKLAAPPARPGVVLRQDLQSLLSEVRLNPLTLVVAPAGYGKTTLLSQWAHDLSRTGAPICWLTLDSGERDTALFLAYLIGSFQAVFPSVGADAWRVLQSAAKIDRDWPLVAGALCSDLQRKVPTSAFLFIDDLHLVIESAAIAQILGYLLRAAPPSLHIVLSSRRAPVFAPLGRMRAEGRLVEITQRDLHLAVDEVRSILAAQDVTLSPEALQLLLERTEGWALSVQLAARALAAQPPEQRASFVRALGGSQEQLLGYLSSEVLADMPAEVLDFLRLTAIPASFDGPLLAEVLQDEGVTYLLQRARALGLPILPMDDQGVRLRFHPLWRELLLRSVSEVLSRDELRALHRRFGQALEARGDLEGALDHYAAARATDDLVRALRERAWPLLRSPRRDMVRRWLEQLPEELRASEPDLLHIWGMSQVAADTSAAAEALERAVELYRANGQFERELRALGDLAALQLQRARTETLDSLCRQSIAAANRVRDAWSTGATRVCVVTMLYGLGRETAALRVSRQATGFPLNPTWRWLLGMVVAAIGVRQGRPAETIASIDETLRVPQIDMDDRLRQNLLRLRAWAQYEQGHVAEATRAALETHRYLGDYDQGGMAGYSAVQLALLLTLQGRLDEAATYRTQARTIFSAKGEQGPLADLQVIEAYAQVLRGQTVDQAELSSIQRRLQDAGRRAPDLRMWLLMAMVFGESGYRQRALALAQETMQLMQARGYRLYLACAWLYIAALLQDDSQTQARDEALRAGWDLMAADDRSSLPMLPVQVVRDVAEAAMRAGIAREAAGRLIRQQLPDQAVELLQQLLNEPAAQVRASAARLLGELGATAAYPALRAHLKDRDAAVRQAVEDALSRLVYRPPYALRVRTLGAFTLWRGDHEVRDRDWRSSKARQLFQILITERGRMLPREWVLEMLWPDMDSEAAANNLRVTINRMSKAVEPERPDGAPSSYVVQQGETYSLNTHAEYELDADMFVAAVNAGRDAEQRGRRVEAIAAYRRAISLYGGPFLPDNMYEDWTVVERERLMLLFDETAIHLGELLLEEGLAHEAIGLAWRVLENDPAQEDAYRLLIRSHAYLGERSTALRLYSRCVSVLQSELGVEPLPETVALFHSLLETGDVRIEPTGG